MVNPPFCALLSVCACLQFATGVAATADRTHIHEARQDPVNIPPQSTVAAPGPISLPHSPPPPVSTSSSPIMPPASATPSPYSISASPSSSSSSASPTPPTSNFSFNAVQNMTTCTSGLITWNYSGQEAEVELSVTNFGVYQDQQRFALGFILAKRQNTAGQMVDQVLADTNATSGSWTWSSVNLPEGWYQAEAAMSDFATSSPQFFIANGSDVSCLSGNLSLSSGTSSSPKSNIGAIIGGVIGGVVGLALVALALTLWFRRRRVPARGHDSRSTNVGRWGSLTSNSSNINAGGNSRNLTNQHYRAHSQSAGEMVPVIAGDKASATTTRGGSDEDATTMGEEKAVTPSSPPGMNPFEALDTPAPYNRRASTYSLQSPSVLADSSRSVRASNQSLEQQAHRIRSSMESSLYLRTERLSMPVLPPLSLPRTPTSPVRSTTRDEYPLSPVTPLPVNRSSSLGGSSGTRRTPRKPVPQYDAAELRQDSAQDTQSTFTATGESSHSHETRGVPELSHKASFGSHRPVHYLIPDMPLPERE